MNTRDIHCVSCETNVQARYITGAEAYPHRPDLKGLRFWKCDICKNFVGTHRNQKGVKKPLGSIPSPAIKKVRQEVHNTIDPLWVGGLIKRKDLYLWLSQELGYKYHTAELNSADEGVRVIKLAQKLERKLKHKRKWA